MTKMEIIPLKNLQADDKWGIALDIGYSSVKLFSPNLVAVIPSYAKRISAPSFGRSADYALLYTDAETNQQWAVGQSAYDALQTGDMTDSASELYGRNHYFSPSFKVISETALAIALRPNMFGDPGGKEIYIQTGLPSKYVEEDRKYITAALAGRHRFSLRIGNGRTEDFDIEIMPENIDVIPQPAGTLYSICYDESGKAVPEAEKYFTSSGLVMDPGFGTLDTFPINGRGNSYETYELGMKNVLEEAASAINSEYGINLSITAMQKCLKEGCVRALDRATLTSNEYPIGEILNAANKKVCDAAIGQILNSYNYLMDYRYLVITGGTGDAWKDMIRDKLKNISTLEVVDGNRNSSLPMLYSNVRGYYQYMIKRLAGN